MAHLACVHAESDVSTRFCLQDRELSSRTVHRRWYAEDLIRVRDLRVLKTISMIPVEMLVRYGHTYVGNVTHKT